MTSRMSLSISQDTDVELNSDHKISHTHLWVNIRLFQASDLQMIPHPSHFEELGKLDKCHYIMILHSTTFV